MTQAFLFDDRSTMQFGASPTGACPATPARLAVWAVTIGGIRRGSGR
jgi:hypothetical protein